MAVEPLYPPELASLPVPDFMSALPTLDAGFAERVSAAAAEGNVLRYAASVDPAAGTLTVGLKAVAASSPLGSLQGACRVTTKECWVAVVVGIATAAIVVVATMRPPCALLPLLAGADNLVEIHTQWYADGRPLVVRGAGAGTGATAAGVLADMVDLAFTRDA